MVMTINQMTELTGKTYRTIKKALAQLIPVRSDEKSDYYETKDALKLIYPTTSEKLAKESFLLERARRRKAEIEVRKLNGELFGINDVIKAVSKDFGIVRAQIRSMPSKLAKPLSLMTDPHDVFAALSESVDEVLTELSAEQKYEKQRDQIGVADQSNTDGALPEPETEPETEPS